LAAIPVTRVEGVTTVISSPSSGVVSGKSTLIDLYGYSPDTMAVMQDVALAMNWPSTGRRGFWDQRDDATIESEYKMTLGTIDEFWNAAIFYNKMMQEYDSNQNNKVRPSVDASMEAMRPVIIGTIPVIIQVDREKDILAVLDWIKTKSESRFILSSVAEGWRLADKIAEAGVPCLVGPVLRTPSRVHENYQRPYQNASILHEAGVKIAMSSRQTLLHDEFLNRDVH
jgi:hypothetical protein